jgi:methyl-accepting chemotaxis protein
MLARLRIGPKLLLAPGMVLLLLVVLSCGAYYAMVRQNQSLETIVGQRAENMRSAGELVARVQKAHADIYRLQTWISGSFSRARIEPLISDLHRQHAAIERGFAELGRLTQDNSAEHRYVDGAASAYRVYVGAVREVIELAHVDQSIGANATMKADAAFATVAQRLAELARLERELSRQASDSAAADFRIMAILMPVVILLAIAVSLAITMAVRRVLLAEIRGIGAAAVGLASGDLTVKEREYGDDEIAETSRALDASIRTLNATLRTILESARSIGSASREISLGSLSLSTRAVFRATSLEHTASSMQELAATVHLTADSAQEVNRLAENASSVARQGADVVDRLVTTMGTVKDSACRMVEVGALIDDIANQAGSLALNVALEAARAGEPGRDFAAMACEVRSLAQRAAAAAREIGELASRSVAEIEGGAAWAAQAGSSMAHIASSVRQVGDIISQISCASAEQASGLSEVNEAIVQMGQVTKQNSAMVEEAAAAARTLQMQALTLSRVVAAFQLDAAVQAPPAKPQAPEESDAPDLRERRRSPHSHLRLASSRE